ncbi:MAG TPA: leucyl aminopeptidase [Actinopolymorphaceae bacterium]
MTARKADAAKVESDVLIVGVRSTDEGISLLQGAESVDQAFGGKLAENLTTVGATGKEEEITVLPSAGVVTAPLVAAVGLGEGEPSLETLRRSGGAVARRFDGKAETIALALGLDEAEQAGAVAEGVLLGAYRFDRYRTSDNGQRRLTSIVLVGGSRPGKDLESALGAAEVTAAAVNRARDWVNQSPSELFPASFADAAEEAAQQVGATFEVLDEKALRSGGYGGLIGVGQGSTNGPRLVRVAYKHPKAEKKVAFVGKGITFDSGGLSLKPNEGMKTMKCDMGGAAAVVAAVLAIAELELPVDVTAWAAMAENMPSGSAQRPSDVIRIYGGKTVEVLNTDAEGRLVLADGIVRASEDRPDVLVDVATLTGACVVALGDRTFGIMSDDDDLRSTVGDAADRAGEAAWPLPIPEGTREKLDSKIADLANVGTTRYGGALTAAAFLREFVGDGIRWAHLDIAGPAFNEGGPHGYTPAGGTGVGVRTLVELVRAL